MARGDKKNEVALSLSPNNFPHGDSGDCWVLIFFQKKTIYVQVSRKLWGGRTLSHAAWSFFSLSHCIVIKRSLLLHELQNTSSRSSHSHTRCFLLRCIKALQPISRRLQHTYMGKTCRPQQRCCIRFSAALRVSNTCSMKPTHQLDRRHRALPPRLWGGRRWRLTLILERRQSHKSSHWSLTSPTWPLTRCSLSSSSDMFTGNEKSLRLLGNCNYRAETFPRDLISPRDRIRNGEKQKG